VFQPYVLSNASQQSYIKYKLYYLTILLIYFILAGTPNACANIKTLSGLFLAAFVKPSISMFNVSLSISTNIGYSPN